MPSTPSRRQFVRAVAAVAAGAAGAALLALPRLARGAAAAHPTPRPGITGAKVLTAEQLGESRKDAVPLFDGIRAIPEIADGIRCHCGCSELPGFYSLLSCFEGDAMAKWCPVCKGTGRLVVRLRKEGKTLDEIRAAVDAQFG